MVTNHVSTCTHKHSSLKSHYVITTREMNLEHENEISRVICTRLASLHHFMLLEAILKNCLIGYHRRRNWNTTQEIIAGICRMLLEKKFWASFLLRKLFLIKFSLQKMCLLVDFVPAWCLGRWWVPQWKNLELCVFERKRCSLPSRLRNHHQNDYTFYTNQAHILMNMFGRDDGSLSSSWE